MLYAIFISASSTKPCVDYKPFYISVLHNTYWEC